MTNLSQFFCPLASNIDMIIGTNFYLYHNIPNSNIDMIHWYQLLSISQHTQ
jgi:hypothetical protein